MDFIYGYCWRTAIPFLFIAVTLRLSASGVQGADSGQLIKISGCTCPEDIVIYNCIVNAPGLGGFTIWRGTAFNECSDVQNRVLLRHNSYQNGGAFGQCGDAIVGRSLRVDPSFIYVSQLEINIAANPGLIGRSVECVYNPSGNTIIPINSTTIAIEEPLPPPTEVQLREVNTNNLIFTWNTVQTDCPTFRYAIRSDCGTCASNSDLQTTQPTVSCSFEQPGTLDNFCSLSVTSLICRNISGSTSVSAGVNLRVPGSPTIYRVIPVYGENNELQSFYISFSETESFSISDGVDGSALYYTVGVFDTDANNVCSQSNITPSSCDQGVCNVSLNVTSCQSRTGSVNVSVMAHNRLGNGPSHNVIVDKISRNVNVSFESTTRVVCTFTEQIDGQNVRNKSCDIAYGPCDHSLATYTTARGRVNSSTTVNIDLLDGITPGYCYVINASTDMYSVQFQGFYRIQAQRSDLVGTVVGSVFAVVVIAVIVAVTVLLVVYLVCKDRICKRRKRGMKTKDSQESLLKRSLKEQCVYAHIIFTIEDELEELVEILRILSEHINIKNIKICQCKDAMDQQKTVYIECDHNFTEDELKNVKNLSESGLPADTDVFPQSQYRLLPENEEHDPKHLRSITEILKHEKGALYSLLKTFSQIEECRNITITDIIHREVPHKKQSKEVTIKFYPTLPRNWRQKFNEHKLSCGYVVVVDTENSTEESAHETAVTSVV